MTTTPAPIERILFPTDFSTFSVHAFRHALTLARRFKARLKVVHVIPHVFPSGESDYFAAPWLMTPEKRQRIEDEMKEFLAPAREARLDHQTEVCEGDPWREIVSQAEEMPADLVVMGTHGRGGLEHLFLGSVAEKLIRRLPCPVLTVCHEEGRIWEAPGLITRILCATDFSETSAEALQMAMAFAREHEAQLTLLNVIEYVPEFTDAMYLGLWTVGPARQDLEKIARERMEKILADRGVEAAKVQVKVAFGRAYKEILRIAAEDRADLLVVGAQGHGLIEHMLSGSNAQHVIRGATCPVLTVRPLRVRPRSGAEPAGLALAAGATNHA